MTNERIISLLDTTHPKGLGRGGFLIRLTHFGGLIYDEYESMILDDFELEYVNPIGPFKKWVKIYAVVKTRKYRYSISFKEEFWKPISEENAFTWYLPEFLTVLRFFSNEEISKQDVQAHFKGCEVCAAKYEYRPDETQDFSAWIRDIKEYNPTVYR